MAQNNMKKILIIVAILISITSITYASALKWSQTKVIPDGNYQELTAWGLSNSNLRIFKFADDNTICYIAYPYLNGNAGTPSMQCSIK